MSQLESGSPSDPRRVSRAPELYRTGIRGTLETPGLVVPPPVSKGAVLAAQLSQALGVGLDSIDRGVRAIARDRRREQAITEEQKRLVEGAAAVESRTYLATTIDGIRRGEIGGDVVNADSDDDALTTFASELVRDRTKGQTEVFANEFAARAEAPILQALLSRREELTSTKKASQAGLLLAATSTAESVESMRGSLAALGKVYPDWNEDQRLEMLVLPTARAAASRGDSERFDMAMQVLGDRFPVERATYAAQLKNTLDAQQAETNREAEAWVVDLENRDVPAEIIRDQIGNLGNTIDAPARIKLETRLSVYEARKLGQAQSESTNGIVRDVVLRRWATDESGQASPLGTVNEIVRRMDLDPKDPHFINADRGGSLLNQIQGAIKFDARVASIGDAMASMVQGKQSVSPSTPATDKDDKALIVNYARAGVVSSTSDGETINLTGIADPIRFAFFSRNFNRVPADAQDIIRSGLASQVPEQVQQAATVYAALHAQAPHLARSIDMDPTAALRARFIASRVERLGPGVLTDNATLSKAVQSFAAPSLQMDATLVGYTREQTLGRVLLNNANASVDPFNRGSFAADVQSKASKAIREGFYESSAFKNLVTSSRIVAMGAKERATLDTVPANVIDTFNGLLEEEFKYARSLTPNEESAIKSAKAWALDRTLALHPPMTWNGRVYFGAKGTPAATQSQLEADLLNPPVNAAPGFKDMAEKRVEELRDGWVPVWDDRQQGFVYRSLVDPFNLYTVWTRDSVGPLVQNPFEHDPNELQQKIDAAIINRRRAKEEAERNAKPNPFPVIDWTRAAVTP